MARSAVLVGRTLADLVRNFFVVILMCVVGFIVGWTIGTDVWGLLGAIAHHPRLLVLAVVGVRHRRALGEGRRDRAGRLVPDPRPAGVRVVGVRAGGDDAVMAAALGRRTSRCRWSSTPPASSPSAGPTSDDVLKAIIWIVGIVAVCAPIAVARYRRARTPHRYAPRPWPATSTPSSPSSPSTRRRRSPPASTSGPSPRRTARHPAGPRHRRAERRPRAARSSALGDETAVCVPCGSALGATWDPELVERVGVMLGDEALTKACRVLLAPTVNLHRSPLAGRNFECYSEDPLLSGTIAAAFVRGVQSQGVVDDGEALRRQRRRVRAQHHQLGDRRARAARDLPRAVRARGPRGRRARGHDRLQPAQRSALRGARGAAHRDPARRVGLRGLRASPTGSSAGSTGGSSAGRARPRDARTRRASTARSLAEAVRAGEVDETVARRRRRPPARACSTGVGALDDPPDWTSTSVDRPEHRGARPRGGDRRRRCCCATTTMLPFDVAAIRVARGARPERRAAADDGRRLGEPRAALPDQPARRAPRHGSATRVDVRFERGVDIDRTRAADPGAAFTAEFFAGRECGGRGGRRRRTVPGRPVLLLDDTPPPGSTSTTSRSGRPRRYVPDETGPHTLLARADRRPGAGARRREGRARRRHGPARPGYRVLRDGQRRDRGDRRAGRRAGRSRSWSSSPSSDGVLLRGVQARPPPSRAARPARPRRRGRGRADAVVVIVGTNDDWESEGHDRDTMDLPGAPGRARRRVSSPPTRTRSSS